MATSYGALCTDFYVNHKLAMKMDLPQERETVLHLFERIRKSVPSMSRFRRFEGELALESSPKDIEYRWLAIWRNQVRSGFVHPPSMQDAYRLHRLILEQVPYHLTISPLDVDYMEINFGFDLECDGNHDQVVADALLADSPLGELLQLPEAKVLDVQPVVSLALSKKGDVQACMEVKTRRKSRRGGSKRFRDDPISVLLSVRRYGPIEKLQDLVNWFDEMSQQAETLCAERVVPTILMPLSRQITSSNA